MKSLREISWQVDEPTYRKDSALSYSTLAKFEREGFEALPHLFDSIETPSLTFGSAVDALITGGKEEFENNFIVLDFPDISDSLKVIAQKLFSLYKDTTRDIKTIDDKELARIGAECDFYNNPKYANYRVKLIKEGCQDYYSALYLAGDKKVISSEVKAKVDAAVRALKESPATLFYFATDNPFDGIERQYQLKFKATFNNIEYRNMADLLIIDHNKKEITPIDLKTSGHPEYDFYKSFITWRYDVQSRLYWRIIRANMDKDDYFKDFKLNNYEFVVVNKDTLNPLVWSFADTQSLGTLTYGKNKTITLRDPFDIGEDLNYYLKATPVVPKGISTYDTNELTEWLNN